MKGKKTMKSSGRGYKTLRYTIPAALCGDLAAVLLTLLSVRLFG